MTAIQKLLGNYPRILKLDLLDIIFLNVLNEQGHSAKVCSSKKKSVKLGKVGPLLEDGLESPGYSEMLAQNVPSH
jgi:hypothetical protein